MTTFEKINFFWDTGRGTTTNTFREKGCFPFTSLQFAAKAAFCIKGKKNKKERDTSFPVLTTLTVQKIKEQVLKPA